MVAAKTVFVYFVRFVKVVNVATLLYYGVVCGLACWNSVDATALDDKGRAFAVLAQIGYIIFILALIVAEFGFRWFERGIYVLHFWLGRGLFLGWIGIQAQNQAEQIVVVTGSGDGVDPDTLKTLYEVAGWALIAIGVMYVVMSVLCLQRLMGTESIEDIDSGFSNLHRKAGHVEEGRDGNVRSQPYRPSSDGSIDEEDVKLLRHAASALGLTIRELRNRFAGNNGEREAQRMFDERQTTLANALREAKELRQASQHRPSGTPPIDGHANAAATLGQGNGAVAHPPGERIRNSDDDQLEALYYGSAGAQQ